jgi:DNA-binding transcriptional regulator LsrR (DeoR family)
MRRRSDLDRLAADIAEDKLLLGKSYEELARKYAVAASTLNTYLNGWLKEGRFQLIDSAAAKTARVGRHDDRLAERLCKETNIWSARVVDVSGAELAYSDSHLDPNTQTAAYSAADALHWSLGEAAATVLQDKLRENIAVGVASGRAVAFTIMCLREKAPKTLSSVRVLSLCGGARVGPWATPSPLGRDLDADANVFDLANLLGVPPSNRQLAEAPISVKNGRRLRTKGFLNIALLGFGVVNSGHHFLQHLGHLGLTEMEEPLRRITSYYAAQPQLRDRVAEIGHRLYAAGPERDLPDGFAEAIAAVNEVVVAFDPAQLKKATEFVLVAGGAQKVSALLALLRGEWPEVPIDVGHTTLVTDTWTAGEMLSRL